MITRLKWKHSRNSYIGFTLPELLIALLILGEIATFTIPKIITAQANGKYNAIAHEDASTLAAAYQQLSLASGISSSTKISDMTQYMNYVSFDTSTTTIDGIYGGTSQACTSTYQCLHLHNGSVMQWRNDASYGGTNTTNGMWVHIDPDGILTDGTTNGPGKSVGIFIYYNGRLSDEGNIASNTVSSAATYSPDATKVPPWFQW